MKNSKSDKNARIQACQLYEVEQEIADRHLRDFSRQAWPVVEPASFVSGWHVDAICDHLEAVSNGQIRRLLICVPPGMGNPCWFLCCGRAGIGSGIPSGGGYL